MNIGTQEIIALGIVCLVVAIAIWRRRKRSQNPSSACDGCHRASPRPSAEQTIHPYRQAGKRRR